MTTNDPALAAAEEIMDYAIDSDGEVSWWDGDKTIYGKDALIIIIRRHYEPLQQQLIGANVELAELRRANEIRTKSQKQLQAEIATNTETILHLQAELFKSRGECERLWKGEPIAGTMVITTLLWEMVTVERDTYKTALVAALEHENHEEGKCGCAWTEKARAALKEEEKDDTEGSNRTAGEVAG